MPSSSTVPVVTQPPDIVAEPTVGVVAEPAVGVVASGVELPNCDIQVNSVTGGA